MIYQYVLSFLFDKEQTAIIFINLINSFSTILLYLVFMFIEISSSYQSKTFTNVHNIFNIKGIIFNSIVTFIVPTYGIIALFHFIFTLYLYENLFNYKINLNNLLKLEYGISPIVIALIITFFI